MLTVHHLDQIAVLEYVYNSVSCHRFSSLPHECWVAVKTSVTRWHWLLECLLDVTQATSVILESFWCRLRVSAERVNAEDLKTCPRCQFLPRITVCSEASFEGQWHLYSRHKNSPRFLLSQTLASILPPPSFYHISPSALLAACPLAAPRLLPLTRFLFIKISSQKDSNFLVALSHHSYFSLALFSSIFMCPFHYCSPRLVDTFLTFLNLTVLLFPLVSPRALRSETIPRLSLPA